MEDDERYFEYVDPDLIHRARTGDKTARNRLVHDLSVAHAVTRQKAYELFGEDIDSGAPEFIWDERSGQSIMVPTGLQADFELGLLQEGLWVDRTQPCTEQLAAQLAVAKFLDELP